MQKTKLVEKAKKLPKKVWGRFKEVSKMGGALLVANLLAHPVQAQVSASKDPLMNPKFVMAEPYPAWFRNFRKPNPPEYYMALGAATLEDIISGRWSKTYWKWVRPAQWESIMDRLELRGRWVNLWRLPEVEAFSSREAVNKVFNEREGTFPTRGGGEIKVRISGKADYLIKFPFMFFITDSSLSTTDREVLKSFMEDTYHTSRKYDFFVPIKVRTQRVGDDLTIMGATPGISYRVVGLKDTTISFRSLVSTRAKLYRVEVSFSEPGAAAFSPIGIFYSLGYPNTTLDNAPYYRGPTTLTLLLYTGFVEACHNRDSVKEVVGSEWVLKEYLTVEACKEILKDTLSHRRFTRGGFLLVKTNPEKRIVTLKEVEAFNNASYWDSKGVPYGWAKVHAFGLGKGEALIYHSNRNGGDRDTLGILVIPKEEVWPHSLSGFYPLDMGK